VGYGRGRSNYAFGDPHEDQLMLEDLSAQGELIGGRNRSSAGRRNPYQDLATNLSEGARYNR
jgi:hypothetical protein